MWCYVNQSVGAEYFGWGCYEWANHLDALEIINNLILYIILRSTINLRRNILAMKGIFQIIQCTKFDQVSNILYLAS